MRNNNKSSVALTGAFFFLFILACLFACQTWVNPDIFVHIVRGNAYLTHLNLSPPLNLLEANPEGNTIWLYQVFTALAVNSFGLTAAQLFFNLLCLLPFLTAFVVSPVLRQSALSICWSLVALLLSEPRFSPRPEVFSWLFVVLQIYGLDLLTKNPSKKIPVLVSLFTMQVVWVNVHSYFPVAMLITLTYIVASLLKHSSTRPLAPAYAFLLLMQFVAGFITPFGTGAYFLVFYYSTALTQLSEYISEFQSPWSVAFLWNVKLFIFYLVVTFFFAIKIFKKNLSASLLALLGIALGASSIRMMPLTIFLTWPLWLSIIQESTLKPGKLENTLLPPALVLILFTIWITLTGQFAESYGSIRTVGIGAAEGVFPLKVANHLKQHSFWGKIFNDSAAGGYLNYSVPTSLVYGDSIFVKPERVKKYLNAYESASFFELDEEHGFDAVVAHTVRMSSLIEMLASSGEWKLCAGELNWSFWVKRDSKHFKQELIAVPDIYHGESLSNLANQESLVHWFNVLIKSRRISHLERLIKSLPPGISLPVEVGRQLQHFALSTGRADFIDLVLAFNRKDR